MLPAGLITVISVAGLICIDLRFAPPEQHRGDSGVRQTLSQQVTSCSLQPSGGLNPCVQFNQRDRRSQHSTR